MTRAEMGWGLNRYGEILVEFEMSKYNSGRVKQKVCGGLKRVQREEAGGERRFSYRVGAIRKEILYMQLKQEVSSVGPQQQCPACFERVLPKHSLKFHPRKRLKHAGQWQSKTRIDQHRLNGS